MTLPDQLIGDVTIVGHHDHQTKLAISHRNITTQDFMKAHVENNSKQGDQNVPPFYFPAPHVSGPDIIFFIKINSNAFPCFVQLKLRQVLEASDVEKALATVSSHAVQGKMEKEQVKQYDSARVQPGQQQQQQPQLQDFCPSGTY
ncbi:hypothetical protein BGX31_006692, partial [Mortierella sp. GBA43]